MRTATRTLDQEPGSGFIRGPALAAAAALATAFGGAATPLHDLLDLVDRDSEDDHCAGDDLLPERRHADDIAAVRGNPITKAPMIVPRTVPRPPESAAPPMTTAAIAFNS